MILILLLLTIISIYPANVSAYCGCEICCGMYADGITASGYKIQPNDKLIAAPDNIPFGTKIYIPGYGLAVVRDRGSAIQDNRLDVYFGDNLENSQSGHERALKWGRKHTWVIIIK